MKIKKQLKYMKLALSQATLSPDKHTQVGAVIIAVPNDKNYNIEIIGVGCNSFHSKVTPRLEKPIKSDYIEHAERMAIYDLVDKLYNEDYIFNESDELVMFCTHPPCGSCANAIVGHKITKIYTFEKNTMGSKCEAGNNILKESGIEVIYMDNINFKYNIQLYKKGEIISF